LDIYVVNVEGEIMKKHIRKFAVLPKLPEKLEPLKEIANNLWWGWDHDAAALMVRIDRDLWELEGNNPLKVLCKVPQKRLEDLSNDESFISHMERVYTRLKAYLSARTWFKSKYDYHSDKVFAYFSAEFGLSETMPIYSGGLGMLAGDHMKSSSDLGVPLCGVGLLYTEGYFRQYLNSDGWQQETYPKNEFFTMPIDLMKDAEDNAYKISVEMPDNGTLYARVWCVKVGRNNIYLLDANISDNPEEYRDVTSRLYGGDTEMRIKQEILLGIGGIRALYAIGKIPVVTHMNEGHSAFLALERTRILMESGLSFDEAKELVIASNVFTTHTPVPAGNDRFSYELIRKYFGSYVPKLGINMEDFLKNGEEPVDVNDRSKGVNFCMTVLALHFAAYDNGVSKLHGTVSRDMWKWMWPELDTNEVPISAITNGVHARTWISFDMASLLDRYLGPRWVDNPWDHDIWKRVKDIPSSELWHTHERRRERLVAFVRGKLRAQLERRGFKGGELEAANEVLDPGALTIGFARRFATYKRATLLFSDLERLTKILSNRERPVQIIFAGKAHPRDDEGKELIKEIVRISRRPELRRHIVFLEDYDMITARYLVQGVDVWLNNPRRPLEASGTSGMKVCFNGGLNLSILDGWWDEAYNGENGWAIGEGEDYTEVADPVYQDNVEGKALYQLLEDNVTPLFYTRASDGHSKGWVEMMKNSMMSNCPVYNTNRMVQEYVSNFYVAGAEAFEKLSQDEFNGAKDLAQWKKKINASWDKIKVLDVKEPVTSKELLRDEAFAIEAFVDLGKLAPEDVIVSVYYGHLDFYGNNILDGKEIIMNPMGQDGSIYKYDAAVKGDTPGKFGYIVRVMANRENLVSRFHFGKVKWEYSY